MNNRQRWFNLIGKTVSTINETINLTQNRIGSIYKETTYPDVFTSNLGTGYSAQNLNISGAYLIDFTTSIVNERIFFYSDLGVNTGTISSGKLYMKYTPAPDAPPIINRYLYRGSQTQAPTFVNSGEYDNFTTLLSNVSTTAGGFVIFTLNSAGISELTAKGTQSFCIRNEYDVNNINPIGINDRPFFTLIGSYFELIK